MVGALFDGMIIALKMRRYGIRGHMHVFSHTTPAERFALFQTARRLGQRARAIEVGSHIGSSALFICAGLEHIQGHLICVDTWMNQTMPDGEKDTFSEFYANTHAYAHRITTARKFSHELTQADIGEPLDFAFLDGDHSETGIRSDFALLSPHIKSGGLVAFHDVIPTFPGVGIVIGEALASGTWQLFQLVDSLCTIRKVA